MSGRREVDVAGLKSRAIGSGLWSTVARDGRPLTIAVSSCLSTESIIEPICTYIETDFAKNPLS